MLKAAFKCLKKDLDFLKDKEVLITIAIATFLALILELGMLYLQNQQIQASNKQVHFNRKTELIKFLYDTKSTMGLLPTPNL